MNGTNSEAEAKQQKTQKCWCRNYRRIQSTWTSVRNTGSDIWVPQQPKVQGCCQCTGGRKAGKICCGWKRAGNWTVYLPRESNSTFLFWLPVAADWKCISYECWISFTGNQASRNLLWRWFVLVRHFRTPVDVIVFFPDSMYKEHLLRVSCGFAWPCHLCIVQQMFVLNYVFP